MLRSFAATAAEYDAWLATCLTTHQRRIRVRVLDLDHNPISDFTTIADGQRTIDITRPTYRVCNVSVVDASRSIGWEPDSASSLHTHLKRMLQVFDERLVPGYGWVGPAVFTGPVVDFDRDGADVALLANGKEHILGDFPRHYSWGAKRKVTAVIRDILEIGGEDPSRIHLPEMDDTLPERLNVARGASILTVVRKTAREQHRVVFPDGRGHWVMRRPPNNHPFTIDAQSLCGPVRVDLEALEFHNRWVILGPKPKGDKKRIGADVSLPKKHPLSAQSLERSGRPRWEIFTEEMSQLKKNSRAREIADHHRDERIRMTQGYSVECLPFPHLEEFDLLRAKDPLTGTVSIRHRQSTLPFVSGAMSIGAVKKRAIVAKGKSGRGGKGGRGGK